MSLRPKHVRVCLAYFGKGLSFHLPTFEVNPKKTANKPTKKVKKVKGKKVKKASFHRGSRARIPNNPEGEDVEGEVVESGGGDEPLDPPERREANNVQIVIPF